MCKGGKGSVLLAGSTRRKHGTATWKPGAKDAYIERELSDFIVNTEGNGRKWLESQKQSNVTLSNDSKRANQMRNA
jgi:hypothetical protein